MVHRLPATCTTVARVVSWGAKTTYAVSSVGSLRLRRTKSQRRQSGCHGAARGSHIQAYQRGPFAPSPALNRDRNRSGCQNLTLAIKTSPVVPSGDGNASRLTSRALGPDPARSPGLYSGAGSACGDHGIHGPYPTGADPHVTGTAEPNLTEFLTPT